jgi:AAA family ATP:ADP antiporter
LSFAIARRPGESRALALSFCYFALLLASYYMIRPLRDALGAGSGAATIKYLATAVFVATLLLVPAFGWLVARVRRTRLLPLTYAFFALNLVVFGVLFRLDAEDPWVARVFYVWTTVFNLFVVSVFWSFMAEVWREEQGRRLFGVIAAGGSLGGLAGPLLTKGLVGSVGTAGVAFIAAGLLAGTVVTIVLLSREVRGDHTTGAPRLEQPVGGAVLAGLSRLARAPFLAGIAALVALGSLLGMIVYIEMARLAGAMYTTAAERTAFFSQRDLWVNGSALLLQFLVVGRLSTRFGVRVTLAGTALLAGVVFAGLALVPALGVLVAANVALRSTEFGIGKPNRDMLYTVVDPETKYKVKNVVDTVIYRGSDVVSSWIHGALVAAGATLACG